MRPDRVTTGTTGAVSAATSPPPLAPVLGPLSPFPLLRLLSFVPPFPPLFSHLAELLPVAESGVSASAKVSNPWSWLSTCGHAVPS